VAVDQKIENVVERMEDSNTPIRIGVRTRFPRVEEAVAVAVVAEVHQH
jgi:4-hydroxy-3-methylbut-2-en-1-yl diphosphate synthase IspG/GcpE